jgi:hypothetical protein
MKKHLCEQGSPDWYELRAGRVTASEAKALVTPKFKIRTGDMVQTLLATKLAEAWIGPLPQFSGWSAEQGQMLEPRAIGAYEFMTGQTVERVGFISSDDERSGCSPDGLLPDCGLEIKSLQPVHHVGCLLDGGLPEEYGAQVHFSMMVTGFPQWKLFCYNRRFPHLLITVNRDEEIQETLREALDDFLAKFDIEWARLVDKNGGPPAPRPTQLSTERPRFSWEPQAEELSEIVP